MVSPQPQWNWTFKGFIDRRGDHIQIWYDKASEDVRAEFDVLLKSIRNRPNADWSDMKRSRALSGKHVRGLVELKFEVERLPYRPLGIFAEGRQTFVILTVAMKSNFDRECATAMTRKGLVEGSPGAYSYDSKCLSDITRKTR